MKSSTISSKTNSEGRLRFRDISRKYDELTPEQKAELQLIHNNGNLIVAMDTETTGLIPGYHEVVQIAVLPLNSRFEPLQTWRGKSVMPFNMHIIPQYPERYDKSSETVRPRTLKEIMEIGKDRGTVAEALERYFERFELGLNKRFIPLGHNLRFDIAMMIEFLGSEQAYGAIFSHQYRDLRQSCLYLNDVAAFSGQEIPFPHTDLRRVAAKLEVPYANGHDALGDCVITAKCYARIAKLPIFL